MGGVLRFTESAEPTRHGSPLPALDIQSARLGALIAARIDDVGADAAALTRLRGVAAGFLPTDAASREAMLLYHAFAAAALTDADLRGAEAFRNADHLVAVLTGLLVEAKAHGEINSDVVPDIAARGLLALVLGLSLGVLLEQTEVTDAEAVLEAYVAGLTGSVHA